MEKSTSFPVLVGSRCVLRVLTVEDAVAWHAGEDEEQRRWFEFPGPAPLENVVRAITDWRNGWESSGPVRQWGVWDAGNLAGGVEIQLRNDARASISYVVFAEHRKKGLAREAVELACTWAFESLPIAAVVGVVDEQNAPSCAVLASAGFRYDDLAEPWEYDESGLMLRYVLLHPETRPDASGD